MMSKKRWCLIQKGAQVFVRYLDPEKEGVLAFLEPDINIYRVEGCKDILQSAREVVLEQKIVKLVYYFKTRYPELVLS